MEVRQLQIFRTLAEEFNFTRTAEKVHTVQSNVTAQIKALEEELGLPLFDRLGRRVTLTDAGRNFLPFASQALAAMDQGQRALQTGAEPSGPLRIGAAREPAHLPLARGVARLPPPLSPRRTHLPSLHRMRRLRLSSKPESSTWRFTAMTRSLPRASSPSALRTERIFLLADASHPLASRPTVKPTDLAGQNLLLTEAGCSYREKLDRALALGNIRPANMTEFSSVEAMKQCVALGMGLGLLAGHRRRPRAAPEPSQSLASGPVHPSTSTHISSGTRTNGFLRPWPPSWIWSRTNCKTRTLPNGKNAGLTEVTGATGQRILRNETGTAPPRRSSADRCSGNRRW